MPTQKNISAYAFAELSEDAKENARGWYRDNCLDDWWAPTLDDTYEIAKRLGLYLGINGKRTPGIYFSGFSSQGDGAYFEGAWYAADVRPGKVREYAPNDEEINRIAVEFERIARAFPCAAFCCKKTGHYCHEHCTAFEVEFPGDLIEDLEYGSVAHSERLSVLREAEEELIEATRDFMRWIYNQLENDYNWMNEDAQVDENITVNGYEFDEGGNRL